MNKLSKNFTGENASALKSQRAFQENSVGRIAQLKKKRRKSWPVNPA